MLTVNEVADRLKLSKQCIYALIDCGDLIAHRFGVGRGTIRVAVDDFQEYVSASRLNKGKERTKAPRPRLKHISLRPCVPGQAND